LIRDNPDEISRKRKRLVICLGEEPEESEKIPKTVEKSNEIAPQKQLSLDEKIDLDLVNNERLKKKYAEQILHLQNAIEAVMEGKYTPKYENKTVKSEKAASHGFFLKEYEMSSKKIN